MPDTPVRLHMGPQEATALLDPIRLELARLSARLDRIIARAELTPADITTLTAAREELAGAQAGISRLQTGASAR